MGPESIVAIVSVCVTGLVSILGILFPAYLECRRSEREQIATKINRIYEKAESLSLSLAKFRNPAYLKEQNSDAEARIELRSNHDAWEVVVFSELTQDERDKVRDMRKSKYGYKHLTGKDDNDEANVMKLIDDVVEFTCSAVERLNSSRSNCGWLHDVFG